MNSRTSTPLGPALALGGALLLLISQFLNWFSLDAGGAGPDVSVGVARPDAAVLLLSLAIAAAALYGFKQLRGDTTDDGGRLSTLVGLLGLAALVYVIVNIIKKPQLLDLASSAFDEAQGVAGDDLEGADFGVGLGIGIFLALIGAALVTAGGVMEHLGGGDRAPRAAGPGTGGGAGLGATPAPTQTLGAPGGGGGAPGGGGGASGGAAPPADRAPGWQPDPYGQARMRYWDGNSWTEHTS